MASLKTRAEASSCEIEWFLFSSNNIRDKAEAYIPTGAVGGNKT